MLYDKSNTRKDIKLVRTKKRYVHIVINDTTNTLVECFKSELAAQRFVAAMYRGAIERGATTVPDYHITRKELQ